MTKPTNIKCKGRRLAISLWSPWQCEIRAERETEHFFPTQYEEEEERGVRWDDLFRLKCRNVKQQPPRKWRRGRASVGVVCDTWLLSSLGFHLGAGGAFRSGSFWNKEAWLVSDPLREREREHPKREALQSFVRRENENETSVERSLNQISVSYRLEILFGCFSCRVCRRQRQL